MAFRLDIQRQPVSGRFHSRKNVRPQVRGYLATPHTTWGDSGTYTPDVPTSTVTFTDDLTGTAGTLLSTMGYTASDYGGGQHPIPKLDGSGNAIASSATYGGAVKTGTALGGPNQWAELVYNFVTGTAATQEVAVWVRSFSGSGNWLANYCAQVKPYNHWIIRDESGAARLEADFGVAPALNTDHTLRVEVSDETVTLKHDGATIGSWNDPSPTQTGAYAGFYFSAATQSPVIRSFRAGTLT